MAVSLGNASIYSDDFQTPPAFPNSTASWTEIEPGTSTITHEGGGTANARAVFNVPDFDVSAIEMWGSKGGVCLEQSCTDNDFTITAKFDAIASVNGTEGGIYVANAGETTGYNCTIFYDAGTTRFAGQFISPYQVYSAGSSDTGIMYLRIDWNATTELIGFYFSTTSTFGAAAGSETATDFVPAKCGVYGANFSTTGADAETIKADYFFESSAEISPEDDIGSDSRVLVI